MPLVIETSITTSLVVKIEPFHKSWPVAVVILVRLQRHKFTFGFAAAINFRSPKTAAGVRAIELDRLVSETDQDDAVLVHESMQRGIQYLAQALDVTKEQVIAKTTRDDMDFYGIV
jgi:Tat protein secretion system quality control protein TatD with DNase activity